MLENNEKILILKALQGDAEAFGLIFDIYAKKIYRFIYFKVRSSELAEDLTSNAFLKIWEYIKNGKKIKQFKPFIYRLARNLIIDYYRNREKEELPLIYGEDELKDELKINPDQEIDKETLEKLLAVLNGEQREIITLRYIEELSIKEVSKIVDKSPGHVRVLIHRTIKELRKYI